MKINMQIEQLALHGFQLTPTDQAELAAALQSELWRLLADTGDRHGWVNLSDQRHIQAKAITYRPYSHPELLGKQIARAVFRGLQ